MLSLCWGLPSNAAEPSIKTLEGACVKKGILIEGGDCSGKSTLVKTLKSRLFTKGWDVLDVGHRGGAQLERYLKLYVNADRVVLDRGHFSEIVYGDLWRQGEHFAIWEKEFLDRYVFEYFIVVRAEAPLPLLLERYKARDYNQVVLEEELKNIQQQFSILMNRPEVITYRSINKDSLNQVTETIVLQMENDFNRT